ncbi:hypothetical protein BsWGS_24183 [Bradybaena similaris]
MSRSKNFYQGIGLGRVQRSEYDDSKLRDLARHDARLGESLKTVDRAKNVMKKSLEADKHMLIKTGLPMTRKTPATSYGVHSHLDSKTPPQQTRIGSDVRVKRFSVTEMPSDLDRTRQYRKKSATRPPSYHEQLTNSPISKEYSSSHDKLLESRPGGHQAEGKNYLSHQAEGKNYVLHQAEGKNYLPQQAEGKNYVLHQAEGKNYVLHQAEASAAFSAFERLRSGETSTSSELDQHSVDPAVRPTTHNANHYKYVKSHPKIDISKSQESVVQQATAGVRFDSDCNHGKSDESPTDNSEEKKDNSCEQSEDKDHDLKPRKRPTIWETLSTPKYTSMTKSKRNQIEQEFTVSRLKSYKSSPALFSTAKTKSHGQGKTSSPDNPNLQGRKVDEFKVKQAVSTRARID